MSEPVRRILVLRFRNLGDVLLATPLLRALKRRYPEARLDYLVEEGLTPLLKGSEDFDRLLAWPRRPRHRWLSDLRWAFRLRREGYDLVLDLHGSVTSALFTGISGAGRRIGYRVRGRHLSYTEKIDREWPRDQEPVYEPERHFRMVRSLGIEPEDLHLRLPKPAPREGPDPWGEGEGARILCTPGATWSAKQWPAAHYAELIRRLDKSGYRVLLVGSADEQGLLAEIAEASPARLRAGTKIREMLSLIDEADLLVGTDSGTRHVAVALGTPSLAIFGPSDPRVWSPVDPMHPVVKRDLDCMPCGLTECPREGHPCMNGLTSERVFDSIQALWQVREAR